MSNKPRIPFIVGPDGKWQLKPDEPNAFEQLIAKLEAVRHTVHASIRPILQAGGGFDEPALKEMILKNSLDCMTRFSREELQVLTAISVSDVVFEEVKSDRHGKGQSDLLS